MQKIDFLSRFQLNTLVNTNKPLFSNNNKVSNNNKEAAVLIPLFERDNQLHVLLTLRASHLKHHAGQVSFPGGKVEPKDKDLIETALREAEEEIGLSRDNCNVLGQLQSYQTLTGFRIKPIVAITPENYVYQMDKNEVAEIFSVPLAFFLNINNHFTVNSQLNGNPHPVTFMPYLHYNIWGATAAILKGLASHLSVEIQN